MHHCVNILVSSQVEKTVLCNMSLIDLDWLSSPVTATTQSSTEEASTRKSTNQAAPSLNSPLESSSQPSKCDESSSKSSLLKQRVEAWTMRLHFADYDTLHFFIFVKLMTSLEASKLSFVKTQLYDLGFTNATHYLSSFKLLVLFTFTWLLFTSPTFYSTSSSFRHQ